MGVFPVLPGNSGMKLLAKKALACCFVMLSMTSQPTAVNSAQQGVEFGGFVGLGRFCHILLIQSGTIAPNVSRTVLSSQEAAGTVGRAQIRTSRVTSGSQFIISVEAPSSFTTAPAELSTGVDFGVNYSSSYQVFNFNDPHGNPNNAPLVSGTLPQFSSAVRLRFPRHATRLDLDVHLQATANTGSFPPGDYASQVTLRCE